jgi:hypothetical protein
MWNRIIQYCIIFSKLNKKTLNITLLCRFWTVTVTVALPMCDNFYYFFHGCHKALQGVIIVTLKKFVTLRLRDSHGNRSKTDRVLFLFLFWKKIKLSKYFESFFLLFDHWLKFIAIRKNSKSCLFLNRLLGLFQWRNYAASFLSVRVTRVIFAQLHMGYSEYPSGWARLVAHYHEPYFYLNSLCVIIKITIWLAKSL